MDESDVQIDDAVIVNCERARGEASLRPKNDPTKDIQLPPVAAK